MCVKKWMHQVSRTTEPLPTSASNLLAAALSFLSVLYLKMRGREDFNPQVFKSETDAQFHKTVTAFLTSKYYDMTCKSLSSFSGYASSASSPERVVRSLPSAGAVLQHAVIHPVLNPSCPMYLLTALFRFISITKSLDCSLDPAGNSWTGLSVYRQTLLSLKTPTLCSNWFSRLESRLMFWALSTQFRTNISEDTHRLSILTSTLLQDPDHLLLRELMNNIVFNEEVLKSDCLLDRSMQSLTLDSTDPFASASSLPGQNLNQILKNCLDETNGIKATYFNKLINDSQCHSSLAYHNYVNKDVKRLCVRRETILSQDWQYFPLLEMYNWEQGGVKKLVKIDDMRNCLAWLVMTDTVSQPTASQKTAKFFRLCTVFLAGSDLFLDPAINALLSILLNNLLKTGVPDFSLAVPGLTSNHEFYMQLLDQFQAVSYGDQLFSAFVCLPLSLSQPPALRRSFWTEKADLARSITLKPQHFQSEVVKDLVEPLETEIDILHAYFTALQEKLVMEKRNDLLYHIALGQMKKIINTATKDPNLLKFRNTVKSQIKDVQLKCDIGLQ